MAEKTAFTGIPRGNDKQALSAVVRNIETFIGVRGSGLDKAVTLRDLVNLNFVATKTRQGKVTQVKSITATELNADTPTKPTGLEATGAWSAIVLTWDANQQIHYAHTEIYRSETNNFGESTKIDTTSSAIYSDSCGENKSYYYWIRHVNSAGKRGPINATAGTFAKTQFDVDGLLEELGEQINSTHLAQTLRDRIDLIDAPVTGLIDQIDSLSGDYSDLSLELSTVATSLIGESGRIDQVIADAGAFEQAANDDIEQLQQSTQEAITKADNTIGALGGLVDEFLSTGVTIPSITSNLEETLQGVSYSTDEVAEAAILSLLKQDELNAKVSKYKFDFETFRDAAFSVDADNGTIDLSVIDAIRSETASSISVVQVGLDAVNSQLSLLATKAEKNELSTTINELSINLNAATADIELKAEQTEVDTLGSSLNQVSIDLDAAESSLLLKAEQTEVDTLGTSVNQLSIDLDAAEASILLKADQSTVNALSTTVNQVSIDLSAANAAIQLKASKTSVDDIDTRLSQAEIDVDALEGEIALKVSKTQFDNIVASEFDVNVQYNKGDQVIYNSRLWECHTDIPAAGAWQSSAYWSDKGQIATRFAQAESRLTVTEGNLSELDDYVSSLNLDDALTTLATAQQTLTTLSDDNLAQADFNQSIQAEFYSSEEAQILSLLQQEGQLIGMSGLRHSIAGIENTQQALATEVESSVESTALLEARLDNALGTIYKSQVIQIKENEARLSENKVITAQVQGNTGAITDVVNLNIDSDTLDGSQLSVLFGDVQDAKGSISTLNQLRLSDSEAYGARFSSIETDLSDETTARTSEISRVDESVATESETRAAAILGLKAQFEENKASINSIKDLTVSEDSALATMINSASATAALGVEKAQSAQTDLLKITTLDSDFLAGTQLLTDLTSLKNEVLDENGVPKLSVEISDLKSLDSDALDGTVLLTTINKLNSQMQGAEGSTLLSGINDLKSLNVDALDGTQFLQTLNQLKADVTDEDGQTKLSAVITAIKTLDQDALAGTQLLADINQLKSVLSDPDTGADLSSLVNDLLQLEQDGATVTQMLSRIQSLEGDVYLPSNGTKLAAEIQKLETLDQDGLAGTQLLNTLDSLKAEVFNENGDSALYGDIENIKHLNLGEDSALAQEFSNLSSYIDESALSQIRQLLTLDEQQAKLKISEANINEAKQTQTTAEQAQAQKNLEIEAKLSEADSKLQIAYAGVVQAYQSIAKETESRVTENKTISAALNTAKEELNGAITALSEVYATPDGVQAIVENNLKTTYNLINEDGTLAVATSSDITESLSGYATEDYAETKKAEAIKSASDEAESRIGTLSQTLAGDKDTEGSIAKAISQYTASNPEGGSATLEQLFSVAYNKGNSASNAAAAAQNTYSAQWSIKTDVADIKGGVGFYNDGETTSFLINANLFSFIGPDNTVTPLFTIRQNVEGYQDGVYMRDVFIDDLAVEDVITKTLIADDFKAVTSTNVKVTGGSIDIASGKFKVNEDGSAEAKAITIKKADGTVLLSSGNGIPSTAVTGLGALATKGSVNYNTDVSGKPDIPAIAQDAINLTYIKNLLAEQVIAARVYAEKIEGDIREDYKVLSAYTGSCEFLREDGSLGSVPISAKPYDRVFSVTQSFLRNYSKVGSILTTYPVSEVPLTIKKDGETVAAGAFNSWYDMFNPNREVTVNVLIEAGESVVLEFFYYGSRTITYTTYTGSGLNQEEENRTEYYHILGDPLRVYSEKPSTTESLQASYN